MTNTTNYRSNKAAVQAATDQGLTEGQYTVTKLGTAKYQLVLTETKTQKTRAVKVNRHWNDDGSLTLYVRDIKVRRIGGDENEGASEEEQEDPEAYAERYLNRTYLKKDGGWVWGRMTQGHNWHTKKQKMLRERIAQLEAAGEDATEQKAELAKISAKS